VHAGGHTQDPPKPHPRLGEVPEGLNMLDRVRMEVVRMALMHQLTDQVQLGLQSKPSWQHGWVSVKTTARAMGSLPCQVAM